MEKTTIKVNFPRELLIVKQGKTELVIYLKEVKLEAIGFPSDEQLRQPLAIAVLLSALSKK